MAPHDILSPSIINTTLWQHALHQKKLPQHHAVHGRLRPRRTSFLLLLRHVIITFAKAAMRFPQEAWSLWRFCSFLCFRCLPCYLLLCTRFAFSKQKYKRLHPNYSNFVKHPFIITAGFLLLMGAGCTTAAPSGTTPVTQDSSSPTPVVETKTWSFPGVLPAEQIHNKQIRLTTSQGDIVFTLYDDTAPKTVSNFVQLAGGGYYDGLIFHRVIGGFMIQGGDPTGTGSGGPGYKFEDELTDSRTYTRGTVAMANAGPNTNGSQFFIMHADVPLPHSYSIFGQVTEGMDEVDAIAAT